METYVVNLLLNMVLVEAHKEQATVSLHLILQLGFHANLESLASFSSHQNIPVVHNYPEKSSNI